MAGCVELCSIIPNKSPLVCSVRLVSAPLNLAFNSFSQHMRAILKALQHFIDASDCPDLDP
jgi:hypothetical protein